MAHGFISRNAGRWQGGKGSRFQRGTGVGQGSLADNLAGGIQDADVMLTITEIQTKDEPADRSGRGSQNNGLVAPQRSAGGRSSFCFHKAENLTRPLTTGLCLLI